MNYTPSDKTRVRRLKQRAVYDRQQVHAILDEGYLVDGLVLARSAFHHSINYRSVVAVGKARLVEDPQERMRALHGITDHVVPDRWKQVRGPNELELKQTSVLALPLHEVSAKVRTGPPVDDEEDYSLPVWAGVLPLETRLQPAISDGRVAPAAEPPDAAIFTRFSNGGR